MDGNFLDYFTFGMLAIVCIFAIAIGIDKMVKIIIGNYLLSAICLAATSTIDLSVAYLTQNPTLQFVFGFTAPQISSFLSQGKITIVLILYAVLLFVIFRHSKLTITIPHADLLQQGLYVILVPLTVMSVILTLQIAILGTKVLLVPDLVAFASAFTKNNFLYNFITLTPVWMLVHGIVTILLSVELNLKYHNE